MGFTEQFFNWSTSSLTSREELLRAVQNERYLKIGMDGKWKSEIKKLKELFQAKSTPIGAQKGIFRWIISLVLTRKLQLRLHSWERMKLQLG